MNKVSDFVGVKATYDNESWKIFGIDNDGGMQMLADIRGWGAIQNMFKNSNGTVDEAKAIEFQDKMGHWIADAINEKLEKERNFIAAVQV